MSRPRRRTHRKRKRGDGAQDHLCNCHHQWLSLIFVTAGWEAERETREKARAEAVRGKGGLN